ncbi:MAG: ATP-binding cassette domain-containing protein, partial [Candidatus Nanopelagicales bacterium]
MGTAGAVPTVRLTGVTKHFGAVIANEGVDLDLFAGEVHAVLGENGAGKSTLMNILFGSVAPDAGEIAIDGETVPWPTTRQAIERGICMVHQHLMAVPTFTVAENVLLSVMWTESGRRMTLQEAGRRVAALAAEHDMPLDPRARIDDLSVGEKLRLEIITCLLQGELCGGLRVLVLDEPTALLTRQEIERLFDIVRALAAAGTAVAIITHKLDEVMEVSDRVTVLRDARRVDTVPTESTTPAQLGTLMVGREPRPRVVQHARPDGPPLLEVAGVRVADGDLTLLDDVSFELRRGEILGVVGVA